MRLSHLLITVALMLSPSALAETEVKNILEPYPEAKSDEIRYVIELPKLLNEDNVKIQLTAGKTIAVDCNRHSFGGAISEVNLEGWGYTYYKVSELIGPRSTRMACGNENKQDEFVSMSDSPLVRYNSKLPIIIYAPKDVVVKYRIWQADVLELNATAK